jgi:hypothetical protein
MPSVTPSGLCQCSRIQSVTGNPGTLNPPDITSLTNPELGK